MRLLIGWAASLAAMVVASTAQAQVLAPTEIGQPAVIVSDVDGPYAAMPPEAPPFVDGPRLLPPTEVYTVVRESGFSPLGVPRQRGFIYTIAVINRDGDDGRLVIDARNGRIVRFMPAYPAGDRFNEGPTAAYGPVGPPPRVIEARVPRPPAPIPQRYSAQRYASRTPSSSVPLPRPAPHAVVAPKHVAAKPKPVASPSQQSAAVETKPTEAKPVAAPAPVETKPSATIEPTQAMPAVQGLN
jgi:hypothetical protein